MMQKESPSEQTRIALIGPILPFRGGIAQHTTMLHRASRDLTNLITISFTRMYPTWLFPGQSDREPAHRNYQESGVEYLIDSLNPLSWRRAVNRVREHRPHIVVIPWWTIYWAPCFWYLAHSFRSAGIKTIFLCHNVVDHETSGWKTALSKLVLKQATSYLVQSKQDQASLTKLLPYAQIKFQPHPLYDQFPQPQNTLKRRAKMELLFFGFVRPYKGLDILIEALTVLPRSEDVILTVAGEFWHGKDDIIKQVKEAALETRVEIIDCYLTEQETAELFQRADLVILPYRSATGSGVISLAYHYNKPVVVTRVGGLPDMVVDGETGLIIEPEDPQSLATALTGISQEVIDAMANNIAVYKKQFTWEEMVQAILSSSSTHEIEQTL